MGDARGVRRQQAFRISRLHDVSLWNEPIAVTVEFRNFSTIGDKSPYHSLRADSRRAVPITYRGALFFDRKIRITRTTTAKIPATTRIRVTLSIVSPSESDYEKGLGSRRATEARASNPLPPFRMCPDCSPRAVLSRLVC